jgi:two-component system OmpR family sensor kinase
LLAEEIIRGSKQVREALELKPLDTASTALQKLLSHKIQGSFIRLIDEALFEELREVRETQLVEQKLNTFLTRR